MSLLTMGMLDSLKASVDALSTPKIYYKRVHEPIALPPYLFEVDWETHTFIINREKQNDEMKAMTSKELADFIVDDLADFLLKESMFYDGKKLYMHKAGDYTEPKNENWVMGVEENGRIIANAAFDTSSHFAYWVLTSLDGRKINRI